MKRGIIIVPKEEMNLDILIEEFEDKEQRHAMYMKKYLDELGHPSKIESYSPYLWGKECIEHGLISLSIDDFTILFLPDAIDKKQCDWFYENSKMISKLKRLSMVYQYRDKSGNLHLLTNEETESALIFDEICNVIEEKYELYENDKKEGVKVCSKVLK